MNFKKYLAILLLLSLASCAHNQEMVEQPVVAGMTKVKAVAKKKAPRTFDMIGCTEGENDLDYEEYLDVVPFSVGEKYTVRGKTYTPKVDVDYKEVGLASWYGGKFHGRRTASGVKFDKRMFTAAHKTLPIPSVARVVNLANQRSVLVVINDRGPFVDGEKRIIDLSRGSAEHLGMLGKGVEKVQVEYLLKESKELLGKLPAEQQEKALVAYQQALTRQMAKLP